MNLRATAKQILINSIQGINVRTAIANSIYMQERVLCMKDLRYCLDDYEAITIIAVGKAAHTMFGGVWKVAEAHTLQHSVKAIVVGPARPYEGPPELLYIPGSHPFPDDNSTRAANEVLSMLAVANEQTLVLFLVSGGASSMLELPLDSTITETDTREFSKALVHSGLSIYKMNVLRKHFSAVKGGRLAVAAGAATQCTLLISDVPTDCLHMIGSGPSLPDPSTSADCIEILRAEGGRLRLPKQVQRFFSSEPPETPKPHDLSFAKSHWSSLLSSDDLSEMASVAAKRMGFYTIVDNHCDDWDYREAAAYLLQRVQGERSRHQRVCIISVGEASVRLPLEHGRGGRNQQFALECARLLSSTKVFASVVSGGSDGVDGNSQAAGAAVDNRTFHRATEAGLDALTELRRFNSYEVFRVLDDAIVTGVTGNNLRDLRLLLSVDGGAASY